MPDVERIEDVLGDWYARQDRGETVDPEELVRSHPDLAEELRVHFDLLGHLDRALADTRPPLPGLPSEIGEYRIVRELGRGGMGVVYEAEQVPMGRRVALKVLSTMVTSTREAVRRFQREARAAGRLHHTNIVPVHAMGEHGGFWFYAMELVRGRSLAKVVEEMRAAPAESAEPLGTTTRNRAYYRDLAKMFAGVAEALDAAHEEGIIHRDVKPSNLLLAEDGALKIVDFGLARLEGDGATVTVTGHLLGTPLYMSPEQAQSRKVRVDHRTDIYSLGATLYEVLTRRPPFRGDSLAEVCSQIETMEPTLPRRVEPRIPRDLETIVLRAMEKDRGRRYATADDLAQDLRAFADGLPIRARRIGPAGRAWRRVKRNKIRSALVGSVVVLVIVGAVLAFWGRGEAERRVELEYAMLCARAEEALARFPRRSEEAEESADLHGGEPAADVFTRAIELAPDRFEAYLGRALARGRELEEKIRDLDAALDRGLSVRTWHLARASVFESTGRHAAADRERERVAAEGPGTPHEAYFEARLFEALGRREQALALVTRAIDESGRGSAVRFLGHSLRARLLEDAGDYPGALRDLTAVQLLGDESIDTTIHVAYLWKRMGKGGVAQSRFEEALAAVSRSGKHAAWHELCLACRHLRSWHDRATFAALGATNPCSLLLTERAIALHRAGRYAESLEASDEVLRLDPDYHDAYDARGRALRNLHRYAEAAKAYDEAVRTDPRCSTARRQRGITLFDLGRYDEALQSLERAIAVEPRHSLNRMQKGYILWHGLDRLEDALASYREALELDPENAEIFTCIGGILTERGYHEEALENLTRALELNPESRWAYGHLSQALFRLGRKDEAEAAARKGIELGPESSAAWFHLAWVLERLGRLADACDALEKAVELNPRNHAALSNLGSILIELMEYEEAIERLLEANRICPGFWNAHYLRGLALRKLDRKEDALTAFEQAQELDPRGVAGFFERAELLGELERHDEAVRAWMRLTELEPENVRVWNNLGCALHWAGKQHGALDAFDRALDIDEAHLTAHQGRGAVLVALGRHGDAAAAYARAIELKAEFESYWNWAYALTMALRYEEALQAFEKLLERWPNRYGARYHRHRLLGMLRRDERALRLLDEALAKDPGNAGLVAEKGHFLARCGRLDDARKCLEDAARLAPNTQGVLRYRLWAYRLMGAYEDAVPIAKRLQEHEPECAFWVATCLRGLGRSDEAREVAGRFVKDHPTSECAVSLGYLCAVAGEEQKARKAIEAFGAQTGDDAYELARIHALLGDPLAALRWLERADEFGHRLPPGVSPESEFEGLADDPRFERIDARLRRTK